MNTDTWTWTTADGLQLHARSWTPQGPAKAVIALVHGLGSHVMRHALVAEALSRAGYAVAGFDQRGFGRSQGRRGHTPSLQAYLQDIGDFLEQLSRRWPALPQVLYGHSMGAVLSLAFVATRRPSLAGLIATAPALRSRVAEQRGKLLLVRCFGRLLPTLSLDNGIDLAQLSRDPALQARVEADPLCHRRVTTAWGLAMLQAIALVESQASRLPVPLLLMHGTGDAIAYPCGSQSFAAAAPPELVTLKLWEGFRHELHSDPQRESVFGLMVEWLDGVLEKGSPLGSQG
jgi:alpha-beta hydrolase superfamily lysophospholipase